MNILGFYQCKRGSAAVEMALVLPILLVLMFGAFEVGNYFLDSHLLAKAIRDGARYASRSLPLQDTCANTIANVSTVRKNTQNIVTYGTLNPTKTDTPPLTGWTTQKVEVKFRCDKTGSPGGLYSSFSDGAPVVTVDIDPANGIQYHSLFGDVGFDNTNLYLHASSEVPVMGL